MDYSNCIIQLTQYKCECHYLEHAHHHDAEHLPSHQKGMCLSKPAEAHSSSQSSSVCCG